MSTVNSWWIETESARMHFTCTSWWPCGWTHNPFKVFRRTPLHTWNSRVSETLEKIYSAVRRTVPLFGNCWPQMYNICLVTALVHKQKDVLGVLCDEQYVPLSTARSNKECCIWPRREDPAMPKSAVVSHSTTKDPSIVYADNNGAGLRAPTHPKH